jgi:hypothetical protein
MKSLLKSIFVPLATLAVPGLFSHAAAAPLVSPMKDLNIYALGSVSASYNSNVLSASSAPTKVDDYIITVTPGIEIKYGGDDSKTSVDLIYNEAFSRYTQHPGLNEELSSVQLTASQSLDKLNLNETFSYIQNYNNSPSSAGTGLTSILRYDTISAGITGDYKLAKLDSSLGFQYSQNTYLYSASSGEQNGETYAIPASAYYIYSDELSFGLAYTYSQTDQQASVSGIPGQDRYSNSIDFSTRFAKFEKLTGSVNVGVVQNHVDGIPNAGTPSTDTITGDYSIGLNYQYSEPLSFNLNGTRNFTVGSAGQNVQNTGLGLGLAYTLSEKWNVSATILNYNYSQYIGTSRADTALNSGITINWSPTDYLKFSAGYTYFMNSSNAANSTYNINVVSITASIKY